MPCMREASDSSIPPPVGAWSSTASCRPISGLFSTSGTLIRPPGRRRKSSGAAPYVGGDSCRRTGAAVLFAGCSPCSCGCLDTDGRCGGRLRNGFCTVRGGGCVPAVVFSYNAVRHGREDFHHHQAECRCNGCYGRIIDAFLQDGFRILAMRLVCMSRNDAEKFYAVHRGGSFSVGSSIS